MVSLTMQINTDCQSRAALLCDFGSQLFATLGVAKAPHAN